MAAARLAIYRVAVSSTRFPSIQSLRWSTSLSKGEEMVVSQTKIETPKLDDGAGENSLHMLRASVHAFLRILPYI